jgi:hypothetical protein
MSETGVEHLGTESPHARRYDPINVLLRPAESEQRIQDDVLIRDLIGIGAVQWRQQIDGALRLAVANIRITQIAARGGPSPPGGACGETE